MSQCGDYEDIIFYVINVFYGIVIAVYFLPFKKNHPVVSMKLWVLKHPYGLSYSHTQGQKSGPFLHFP